MPETPNLLGASSAVTWPKGYAPEQVAFHVVNRLGCRQPPESIWQRLVHAAGWPSFYANAKNVRVEGGAALAKGARFTWTTFGFNLQSEVITCEPTGKLTWLATGFGIKACHAWLIEPTADGCTITTEETQIGWMAYVGKPFIPGGVYKWHQRWLEGLAKDDV
jgi:hypothetical protein